METENTFNEEVAALQLTENSKEYLRTTAKWTKFMAVISFIGIGFLALSGLILTLTGFFIPYDTLNGMMLFPLGITGVIYFILSLVIIIPTLYLYRFSQKTIESLESNNSETLESAIENMKSYWKFNGILTIVSIALCVLVVPIVLIIAVASAI
jgi:NADH:ubiquinone oxidoreductase subunit 5 (subunit L)/multisubunit Na+/H+ antiporter MnhA subunit